MEPESKRFCSKYGCESHLATTEKCVLTNNDGTFPKHGNPKRKRKTPKSLHNQYSTMKQKAEEFNKEETDYYFDNGFRKVYPYYFTFHTFCKGAIKKREVNKYC